MAVEQLTHEQVRKQQWRGALWFIAVFVGAEGAVWLWMRSGRLMFGLSSDEAFRVTAFFIIAVQILIHTTRALRDGYLYTTKKLVFRQEQPAVFFAIVAGLLVFSLFVLLGPAGALLGPVRPQGH